MGSGELLVAVLLLSAVFSFPDVKFDCPRLPKQPPAKDVHHLRAQDISLAMAMGDSMTAGFGMKSGRIWNVWTLVEYRGQVYSVGGDEGAMSVANYLKHYNPNITGMSIGNSAPLDVLKWPWSDDVLQPFSPKITHLNAAQSGAKVQQLPGQVDYLVQQIKENYPEHTDSYKMLSILIGANNACLFCKGDPANSPETYGKVMEEVLNKIEKELNNTFVNILPMFDIVGGGVYDLGYNISYCYVMWFDLLTTECPCMQGRSDYGDRLAMDIATAGYRAQLKAVVDKINARPRSKHFKVTLQPCISELKIPSEDFLSRFDCFHPNIDADIAMSVGLWNNMWTPPGKKRTKLEIDKLKFKCPTVDDYLQ